MYSHIYIVSLLPLLLAPRGFPVEFTRRQVVLDPLEVNASLSITSVSASATSSSTSASPSSSAGATSDSAITTPTVNTTGTGEADPSDTAISTSDTSDPNLTVVKFAALAEALEASFYDQALQKFSPQSFTEAGFADGQAIFDQIGVILEDEKTHLSVLQSVATSMGGSTSDLDTCTFNFDSALTDVPTFLATARVLEFIGVDAYIGGTTLITDKALLVSAAEIATVEARHNTVLNLLNGGSSIPSPFDMVLTPQQVLSLAAPFISGGCDPVAALGLTPTPSLTVTYAGPVAPGTLVTFGGASLEGKDQTTLFCQMIVGGAAEAVVFPVSSCVVPEGLDGPVHIFVTSSETPLSANIVTQDAAAIVAGPAVAFIDTIPNIITTRLKTQSDISTGPVISSNHEGSAYGLGPSEHRSGKKVVVTKITVTKTRHGLGVHDPVDGGQGGAVALGWY